MCPAEFIGTVDEILGSHGEELGTVLCRIGIEERVLATIDGIEQRFELVLQVGGPLGDGARPGIRASRRRRRSARPRPSASR